MSKRSKFRWAGMVGASLVAGCAAPTMSNSGGTAPVQQPPPDAQQQADVRQVDVQQPTGAMAAVNAIDQEFVSAVGRANAAEIALSQMAVQRASREEVRRFAQRMVTDHTQAGQLLQQAATQAGLTVPQDLTPESQATSQRLSSLTGAAFDQAYLAVAVQSHVQSVTRLQNEISQGQHPAIQGFARQILPTVQDHLRAARELVGGDQAAPTS